jgi:hypothetical protein
MLSLKEVNFKDLTRQTERPQADNEYLSPEIQKMELHREVYQICTSCKREILDHPIMPFYIVPAHGKDCPFRWVDKYP